MRVRAVMRTWNTVALASIDIISYSRYHGQAPGHDGGGVDVGHGPAPHLVTHLAGRRRIGLISTVSRLCYVHCMFANAV